MLDAILIGIGLACPHSIEMFRVSARCQSSQVVFGQDSVRSGRLEGQVVDEKGAAISGATVHLTPGNRQRRTDASGNFAFDSLASGDYTVTARTIGRAAVTGTLSVARGKTTSATLEMGAVQSLDTVVTREAAKSRDRQEYEHRRALRTGYALDGEKLKVRADMYSALSTFPRMQLTRQAFGVAVRMEPSRCKPTVFLDGMKAEIELATSLPIEQLRAIEVFTQPMDAPAEFRNFGGCAFILFWSTKHKW